MPSEFIAINFFPVEKQDFFIHIYEKEAKNEETKKIFSFPVKKFSLSANEQNEERINYWVSFEAHDGFIKKLISSLENRYLTIWYLSNLIEYKLKNSNLKFETKDNFQEYFDFIVGESNLGREAIRIIPSYQNKKYGVLLDYHFIKNEDIPYSIEVQKKSLSLDKTDQANKNYYRDKYSKIESFIKSNFNTIFNPLDDESLIIISNSMENLECRRLETKKYVFCKDNISNSQFQGMLKYGPYSDLKEKCMLGFVYRNREKTLSYELYYALRGERFPTFKGMEKMFNFPVAKNNVIGEGVEDYNEAEIEKIINNILSRSKGKRIVPIIIVPWNKETANEYQAKLYYLMKYELLKKNIACQFVDIERIRNYNSFKWSVSGIALQIFTKLGGSPWCLQSGTEKCLIIGIGQAHRKNSNNNEIERYYSYSIQNDSSGLFRNIKLLSDNTDHDKYLNGLSDNLKDIIISQINQFDSFVVHTPFRLRKEELNTIKTVIESLSAETGKEFAVLRFNDAHYYMGYDFSNNALTPNESTYIQISSNNYLVWFEGLQYGYSSVRKRISPPVQISIDFLTDNQYKIIFKYLQDAINLSGANWRGFNAKNIPVSILYARLLSGFISAFEKHEFDDIDIENITPWFL